MNRREQGEIRSAAAGFTLIELLIVIVVLGVLAAVVVIAVGESRNNAVQGVCKTRVRSIVGSAEAVRVRLAAYPIGTVDAAVLPNPLVAPAPGALLARWPTDPRFVLRYEGTGGTSYAVDVYRADGTTLVSGCSDL